MRNRLWLGSLAATSMLVGRPLPLFSSWDGSRVFWVLGLFTGIWNLVWVGGVGCVLITFLAACVRSTRLILFLFVSSRNAWKVLQHLLCHALCALPQSQSSSSIMGGWNCKVGSLALFSLVLYYSIAVPLGGAGIVLAWWLRGKHRNP